MKNIVSNRQNRYASIGDQDLMIEEEVVQSTFIVEQLNDATGEWVYLCTERSEWCARKQALRTAAQWNVTCRIRS